MGLLMRSPPVDLSSESIYYLRSRRSQAAVGNARSTSLVVLVKSASMVPRPEARCPAGALFTRVPRETVRKRLGGVCDVALRAAETYFWAHFCHCIPARYSLRALLAPFSDSFRREILRSTVPLGAS